MTSSSNLLGFDQMFCFVPNKNSYVKWITNKDVAEGTLLNVMGRLGWEGNLGKNGYMYMRG